MGSNKQQRLLEEIRNQWGEEKASTFNPELARIFFDLRYPPNDEDQVLDDRLVNDLDLDRVFQKLDHSNSAIGHQYLYDKIRRPSRNFSRLQAFDQLVLHFETKVSERENNQILLAQLNDLSDYFFPVLFFKDPPDPPKWLAWISLLRGITFGSLAVSFFYPIGFIAFLLMLPVNMFIHYRNKNRLGMYAKVFARLQILYSTGKQLTVPKTPDQEREREAHFVILTQLLRKISWLKLDHLREHEGLSVLWFFLELAKALTLSEVTTLHQTLEDIQEQQASLLYLYQEVGEIDGAIAVASYRAAIPYYCQPEFTAPNKRLIISSVLHPLLPEGVENDLELLEKSMLLTGSNMSGKTTYIRTIGLNVILAQTIMTPLCKDYQAPFLHLGTSIKIQDDVTQDKSYYLEEVMVIGKLIQAAQTPQPYLFIIDEMFKGTNTVERISAAKAVLSFLNQGSNMVLISTHDLELTAYLGEEFDLYYFQEQLTDSKLTFDYKIKKGKLQQRNAIKILEIMDYPKEIVAEAHQLAAQMGLSQG